MRIAAIATLVFAVVGRWAHAQQVAEMPFFHSPPGSAALGGGLRLGNDVYLRPDNDDQRQVDLVPLYLYEGKYLFARGTSGGVHLVDNDIIELNAFARYRFQQLDPSRNAFYDGIARRRQTVDAGVQARLSGAWGELEVNWLTDTLDRHNGNELEFAYRYRLVAGAWSISPFVNWRFQDDDLTDYYFGVSEAEARPDLPAYTPGASEWFGFGVNTAWHVSPRIVFFANVGFYGTESAVIESPLLEEDNVSVGFLGGSYTFGNVREPADIQDPERAGEWSWRVNYGYQADGNIVGEIDQGDFSKSGVADTNIAGLTLGKLLHDGSRVDFLGRAAWFRHLEDDEGNGNFNSWAAYIMAMGKGYSPWSGDEWFRWGFAFGMSYAETVPIAEQRKQAAKGGNTAHFLNYLEMQLDFPLRRLSSARWLQSCYAGLSIVHRSGIFGTSDILGDVAGGSDWITAHLECLR